MTRSKRSAEVRLATCSALPSSDGDDAGLPGALAELGIRASWAVWDDPDEDFSAADLVVLRSTWDYTTRRDKFLRWCESVPGLVNSADIVRWNTDKSYLGDLIRAGIPVVPTQLVPPGSRADWPDAEFVLKPAVGAGSRDAARFVPGDGEDAQKHLDMLHGSGRTAVLQPYQEAVDREGETALVFLGGIYSHAFVKGPMLAPSAESDESGLFIAEGLRPVEPDTALRAAAEDALDAACALRGMQRWSLLYVRIDLVRAADGAPLLLELELSEPSLGFRQTDASAALRFASAVRAALTRR